MDFTENQIERYSRQMILKEVGGIGQKKLLESTISIIGMGGLGSPAALYLTAAGIGNIRIIDYDNVDISNLHRQILHYTPDIKRKKVESAYEKLHDLNPEITIKVIDTQLAPSNIKSILRGSDFVIEGSDNISTKMLVNDACINLKIPFSIAGVLQFNGQILTVVPNEKTSCYRCVFGEIRDDSNMLNCAQAGVIGPAVGIVGNLQANEALKYLLNIGDLFTNKILFIDFLKNIFHEIEVKRNPNCLACGDNSEDLVMTYDYNMREICTDE